MTEPDDLSRRLDELGATTPPPPTELLLADLDASRLRRPPARARVLRLPVVLPAAAVAAAVLGFVLLAFGGASAPKTITIATASDASVLQADQAVPAASGLELEEGAHITTGPAGSVTVGGETLGPNEEAVVANGRLRRIRRYLRQQAANVPVTLRLVGRRRADGDVGLAWSTYEGADFARYVVLRGDRDVVARRPSPEGREAADRAAPAETTRYVVVVLDAADRPVARSQVIRL
jgi:hypothetical protein